MASATKEKIVIRSTFYREGEATYWNWGSEKDCPYVEGDARRDEWFSGWFDAASDGGTL